VPGFADLPQVGRYRVNFTPGSLNEWYSVFVPLPPRLGAKLVALEIIDITEYKKQAGLDEEIRLSAVSLRLKQM
jgi:hypothetical protein